MIRFQDTVEKKDTSELLSSATFQDIRPTGSMSTEDAVLFLDGLFSIDPESQDMYSIDEESLLAEIFGRFEDEFDFDFELDDEIQTVLDRFGAAKWENLSDGEKTDAINELASVIAKKLGIYEEPRIHFCDGQNGACGAFVPEENKIEINRNILTDPKEVVDTIAHEMRHAYQHQRAEMLETWQDFLYRLNFENYISPVSLADGKYLFFTDYQNQLVEAEARAFANIFTHKEVA